jgi:ferredoxin
MSETEKTGTWRLVVDTERCQGHNRCYALAPELFHIDDLGFASAAADRVPAASLEQARLAARNCPEFAIRLERTDRQGDEA